MTKQKDKALASQEIPGARALSFPITAYNAFMVQDLGSLRARLRETADQAWRLYCALEHDIPHRKSNTSGQEIGRQRLSASTIPWNSAAAELTLEFHRKIRHLESELNQRITGAPKRRGSSSTNTRYAVDSVINLCVTSDQETVLGVLNYLTTWSRRADTLYNPENGLHRLPREPGQGEAVCPYCERQSMRWNPTRGLAVCLYPACRNHDGHRPRWTAEFTLTDNGLTFRWDEQEAA